GEAILFLRQWSEVTDVFDKAEIVIDHALDLLIRSAEYTPKIRDLRALAAPLVGISDRSVLARLVARFESQTATVCDLGTNEDLTRLKMRVAAAEARLDLTKAQDRLLEVYWEVSEVKDLGVKAACLSWMLMHYGE